MWGLTPSRGKTFLCLQNVDTGSERSACYLVGTGVKWTGREATHSFTSDAEVKNKWSYVRTPF
jgi:hypothetical protein